MTDIKFPTYSDSKSTEVECLVQIRKNIAPGTYLDSLISESLVDWFKSQTRDDLGCDIMAEVNYLTDTRDQEIKVNNKLNQRVNDLTEVIKSMTREYEKGETTKLELNILLMNLQGDFTELQTQYSILQDQNKRLKAHLFDLEHGSDY